MPPDPGRRRLIAAGLAGIAAGTVPFARAERTQPPRASASFDPQVEIDLAAVPDEVSLLPGSPTLLWRFTGRVLRGPAASFALAPGSRHLPVIRVRRGARLRVHFTNRLSEPSIVHWHGLNIAQRMDGHPMHAIEPGERYVYEFEVAQRAGTYWFHPHPHGRTGAQVYAGLAGFLIVHDDEEDAARLPAADADIPLALQDRSFEAGNQLVYIGRGMMDRMMGFRGEQLLVNGARDLALDVPRRAHRLRLFNGSNATTWRLGWRDGRPLTIVGTDGGLLERASTVQWLTLAPAQRADVWIDLAARAAGEEIALLAEPFTPMLARGLARPAADGGTVHIALRLRTHGPAAAASPLPARLSQMPRPQIAQAVNRERPRTFRLAMMRGQALINGRVWSDGPIGEDETVRLNDTEVWEFANDAPMGMQMAHPMHVHNVSFEVIERVAARRVNDAQRALAEGIHDAGLQDTVLVLPGERVRVLMKFEHHPGIYLYHCHVLEHEDLGMMRNFLIRKG